MNPFFYQIHSSASLLITYFTLSQLPLYQPPRQQPRDSFYCYSEMWPLFLIIHIFIFFYFLFHFLEQIRKWLLFPEKEVNVVWVYAPKHFWLTFWRPCSIVSQSTAGKSESQYDSHPSANELFHSQKAFKHFLFSIVLKFYKDIWVHNECFWKSSELIN